MHLLHVTYNAVVQITDKPILTSFLYPCLRQVLMETLWAHFCVSWDNKPKRVAEQPGDRKMHILHPG